MSNMIPNKVIVNGYMLHFLVKPEVDREISCTNSKFLIQSASTTHKERARYSALIDERATIFCYFEY